jgi:hypothetical protein
MLEQLLTTFEFYTLSAPINNSFVIHIVTPCIKRGLVAYMGPVVFGPSAHLILWGHYSL